MERRLAAKTTRIGSLKTPNTDIPTAIGCAASLRTLFTKQPENPKQRIPQPKGSLKNN